METYILFIYGSFKDHKEIELFCTDILPEVNSIKNLKFVIENEDLKSIIIIFESDLEHKEIAHDLINITVFETIQFYFLFPLDKIITARLPENLKDIIFKPTYNYDVHKIDKSNVDSELDLDEVLDKIDKSGFGSLSEEEKKFLDNF
jgi:hypothetical protein